MKRHITVLSSLFSLFLLFAAAAPTASAQTQTTAEQVKTDADGNYLILSTKKIETMEKELDAAAAKGFRVLYGAPTVSYDMTLFLERSGAAERSYNYKILATSRIKTMEKELNAQAALGYRILPRTIIFKQGFLTAELLTVMERETDSKTVYEYKLVEAGKESKLQSKIDAVRADGFVPVTMITLGENIVVMEKSTAAK